MGCITFQNNIQMRAMWNPELALNHLLLKITAADK